MKTNKPKWDTPDGHSPLVAFLSRLGALSKEVVAEIDKNTFPLFIKKKKLILTPGAYTDHIYLIIKGVLHGYIKEDGKQVTTWLNCENEIVGALHELGSENHSEEYLQALEDTLVVAIPLSYMETFFIKYPETNIIGRKLWQYSYHKAIERAFTCRLSSARKKYLRFIETHPNISNRVPLKYIASYLGITQETLSRIRSSKMKP